MKKARLANSLVIRKTILPISVLAICCCHFISSSSAGENRTSKSLPGVKTHHGLSSVEQRLNDATGRIETAPNEVVRKSYEANARSYLPSIADPDSRLMWEAAILAAGKDYERSDMVLAKVKHFDRGTFYCLKMAAKTSAALLKSDDTIELCTHALRKKKDEEMLTMQAYAYISKKKFAEASRDYTEAATINYAAQNYCRAACCLMKNNEPGQALVYVDKAFQRANEDDLPSCYYTKGLCFSSSNRPKEAAAAFTNALDRYAKLRKSSSKEPDRSYDVLVSNCLDERSKCYDKLGMTAEAANDRQKKGAFAREVEKELFGK